MAANTKHVDQLKDEMSAYVASSLHVQLFDEDIQQQLSAVSTLSQSVTDEREAAISCSDLLLQWATLKLSNTTNISVNIKSLEFLQNLFKVFETSKYQLSDCEAHSLLPCLVLKV